MSEAFELRRSQFVPAPLGEVFRFFEDPRNLEQITPPFLRFRVVSTSDEEVRLDTRIEYRLRWQIFPMRWNSRISEYEKNVMFADEMLRGPYRRWYHRHYFEEVEGGVEILDVVEYQLPLGPLGRVAHAVVVRRQLEEIFDYRHQMIQKLFPGTDPSRQ
jgi:ligand-binding SRPBCC domain-containing protein